MPVDPRLGRGLLAIWLLISFGLLAPLFLGLGSAPGMGALAEPSARRVLRLGQNTLQLAFLASIIASIWAVPIALAAMKCSSAHARLIMLGAASLPLFVPPSALVVAAIRLFGAGGFLTEIIWGAGTVFPLGEGLGTSPVNLPGAPIYTLPGGSFVLAWSLFPLVVVALAVALARGDSDAERAALLETGPFKVMGRISLPLASGGLAVGACLVFLFSLTNFSIPESLRGLPVLVTEVYVQFGVYYDTRRALEAALVLLMLSLIGIGVAGGLLRRFSLAESAHGDAANVGSFRFPSSWQTLMMRMLGWSAAVLPMLALVYVLARTATGPQGTLEVWRTTWITAREEFFFTMGLGLLTAAGASILGLALGSALASIRPSWLLRLLIAAPLVIPGPIYGIAMQILLRRPPDSLPIGIDNALADLSRTTAPLILAWCVQFAPIMALISERLLRAVPHEEREAAVLDGASLIARWKALYWPAVWPGVAAGALVVFALTLGEEGAAVLLLPPGPTTLGVRLLTLMHYAPTGQVSALCLLMMVPGVLAFLLAAGFVYLRQRG